MAIMEQPRDDDFLSGIGETDDFKPVRTVTPLVSEILRQYNFFLITRRKGLEAIGVDPLSISPKIGPNPQEGEEDTRPDNPDYNPAAGMALVPGFAAAMLAMTCTRQDLMRFAENPKSFKTAALEFLDSTTHDKILAAIPVIEEAFSHANRSAAVIPPDQHTPIGKMEDETAKKPVPAGSLNGSYPYVPSLAGQ